MSALAVIQARMRSTRLPGKSLADIAGEPSLALLVKRLERARRLDTVVVATSVDPADDPVERVARDLGCEVHRGPHDDVLTRFVEATRDHEGTVVRITADCPLTDPGLVDRVVGLLHRNPEARYASNVEPRSFPVGLDIEAFGTEALREVDRSAREPELREHVTLAMRRLPERFPHVTLTNPEDLSGLRWTIDHADDLEFVRRLVPRLGERRYSAGVDETLAAVRRAPSLAAFGGRRG